MQQANSVSSVLPVSPAAPMPGNSANSTSASSGSDGQPAFSQVLRDKQMANADAANASNSSSSSSAPNTSKTDEKPAAEAKSTGNNDTGVSADKRSAEEIASESTARTPAELAQLLAAAGLLASAGTAQNAAAANSADSATLADTAVTDATAKRVADPGILSLAQTDKTAAASTNLAASLAANTANSTTSPEQALASQSALPGTDAKAGQAGAQSGDQQDTDKQTLLAAAANADGDKLRANGAASEASFASALERAGQNGGVATAVNAATQTQAPPAATHTVTTPVGRQGWADEVGQRVLWTAKSDTSRADLVLTPPQLGRIEVSIQMNGDQANATFMAANPVAREALQDAMPRLRELMAQAGIQLGQADVSAGQSGQNGGQGARRQAGRNGGNGMLGSDVALGGTSSGWTRGGSGMVDTFA